MICSFNFLIFLAVCLNISTVINIKILTNSNQQTQSYKFTSHIAAFLSVFLITEMLEICIQTSYDQNVQLILRELSPCRVWYHLKLVTEIKHMIIFRRQSAEKNPKNNVFIPFSDFLHGRQHMTSSSQS